MEKLKIWKYKHFKWNEYEVIWIAKNSENPEEEFVVYKALYWEWWIWIRPLKMFLETIERDWKSIKRFKYIEN